jgi:hypothetical protein
VHVKHQSAQASLLLLPLPLLPLLLLSLLLLWWCYQEAGIPRKLAPTIGIAVDHRRRNRSLESLQVGSSSCQWQQQQPVAAARAIGSSKG